MSMSYPRFERRWLALALLVAAQFMVIIDLAIVIIALPSIQRTLNFSADSLQWVLGAYLLTFGGCLMLGGRASDLFGRRRVFMAGLVVFGLATVSCGLAQNSAEMVAARAVQGLGGAFFSPAALGLLALTFTEERERVKAMSLWTVAASAGGAIGLVLGGLLTSGPGWRWVFWINVPFVAAALAFAPSLLSPGKGGNENRRLDVAGAVVATAGLSALIYGLTELAVPGTGWPKFGIPLAAGVVLLAAFIVVEHRAAQPLLPLGFFRQRLPALANWVMLAFAAAVIAMNFIITLYLQRVLHYSPLETGLAFLPMSISTLVVCQVAARVLARLGLRTVLLIGLVAGAGALFWFGAIPPRGSYLADVLGPAILLGSSAGFTVVAVMTGAVSGVSERDAGLAGGLINTAQQLGGALGVAAFASLAAWHTSQLAGGTVPDGTALTAGYRLALNGGAILVLLAAALAAPLLARRSREAPAESAPAPAMAEPQPAPAATMAEPRPAPAPMMAEPRPAPAPMMAEPQSAAVPQRMSELYPRREETPIMRLDILNPPYKPVDVERIEKFRADDADGERIPQYSMRLMMLHHPDLAEGMRQTDRLFLDPSRSSLDLRTREIVVGRTLARCHCEYQWGIHQAIFGDAAGLTDAKRISLVYGQPGDSVWEEKERALIHVVDEIFDSSTLCGKTWNTLLSFITEQQALETLALIGWCQLNSYLSNAAQLPPESFAARFPPPPPSPL